MTENCLILVPPSDCPFHPYKLLKLPDGCSGCCGSASRSVLPNGEEGAKPIWLARGRREPQGLWRHSNLWAKPCLAAWTHFLGALVQISPESQGISPDRQENWLSMPYLNYLLKKNKLESHGVVRLAAAFALATARASRPHITGFRDLVAVVPFLATETQLRITRTAPLPSSQTATMKAIDQFLPNRAALVFLRLSQDDVGWNCESDPSNPARSWQGLFSFLSQSKLLFIWEYNPPSFLAGDCPQITGGPGPEACPVF